MAASAGNGQAAERARLHEMMAVGEAERTVADARMADLKAAQDAARRSHIAAKGLVTRARKDGSAEKIAAAVKREREAYTEFMAVSDAAIDEMFVINRAGLDRLAGLLGHHLPMARANRVSIAVSNGRGSRST